MKKFLVVIGVAVLTVALAVPASAQFKTWGSMQIAGTWIQNQDFNAGGRPSHRISSPQGKDQDLTYKSIWERFNFFLQYGDPKTVRAVIGFEADSTDWGEPTRAAAGANPGEGDYMGGSNTDKNMLGIKWAFIEFMVPNTPLQVTAGIQNFAYGGRLVEGQDSMGISVAALFAPHKITGMWYRRNDDPTYPTPIGTTPSTFTYSTSNYTGRFNYHVNDFYAVKYNLVQKAFNVEGFFSYQNDLYSGYQTTVVGADQFADHPWWLGANATFMPGNWTIYGQFVYKGGERKYEGATAAHPDKVKYQAYAAEVEAKYKIGPGMFAIGEIYYATGNDADATDKSKMFTITPGSEANSSFAIRRSIFMWMNFAEFANQHQKNYDIGGFYYGRLAFEYAPTTWLNLILNYLYIGDTSKGTASLAAPKAGVNSGFGARTDSDEDFQGHEINVIANLKIYEPLMLNIGAGVFIPGKVYDLPNTATTGDAGTAYMGVAKLVYAF
jgi:hypothetical protein